MGMPCEVNSVLKLRPAQGFPSVLVDGAHLTGFKDGYRIYPVDVPLFLVDEHWQVCALVVIETLVWGGEETRVDFKVIKLLPKTPYPGQW